METLRIIEHGNGHTDIEALIFGEWVVVKCIENTGETTMKQVLDQKRFEDAYEMLVDETDNPMTHRDREKNQRLNDLLELFEYLRGEDDINPLVRWFEIEAGA